MLKEELVDRTHLHKVAFADLLRDQVYEMLFVGSGETHDHNLDSFDRVVQTCLRARVFSFRLQQRYLVDILLVTMSTSHQFAKSVCASPLDLNLAVR